MLPQPDRASGDLCPILAQMKMAPALSFRNAHRTVTVWAEAVSKGMLAFRVGMSTICRPDLPTGCGGDDTASDKVGDKGSNLKL